MRINAHKRRVGATFTEWVLWRNEQGRLTMWYRTAMAMCTSRLIVWHEKMIKLQVRECWDVWRMMIPELRRICRSEFAIS